MPELIDRPRPWIARHHPVDKCCDPSRRMADIITLHAVAGQAGRFALIKLLDGSEVQRTTFPTRGEAERFKTHPAQIVIQVPPAGMRPSEAEEVLHYHREIYDKLGGRPLELPHLMPLTRADMARQIAAFKRG